MRDPGGNRPAQDRPPNSVRDHGTDPGFAARPVGRAPTDRGPYVFPSRIHDQPHLTARQYARIVHGWIEGAGMDSTAYGTHSLRRTKAAQIYRKTGNLRAVQLLLEMAT